METSDQSLHIVVFPWLAMGHFIPFLRLSNHLAQKGHRISFVSTPKNIQKLPTKSSSPLISFISLPLPSVENLPENAESSIDIPHHLSQFLKKAFDSLENPLTRLLIDSKPDWIIFDYAAHWLPMVSTRIGVSCAYFCLFTASFLCYLGPSTVVDTRSTAEDFSVSPDWVTFESNIAFSVHQMAKNMDGMGKTESGVPDMVRFREAVEKSDVVVIRSSVEFEPEWFNLFNGLYGKKLLPIGFLPPSIKAVEDDEDEVWIRIKKWLDKQRPESVVYVALGTEATLSRDELSELALGLEKSGLPFLFVLRKPTGWNQNESTMLPNGFEELTKGRGMVYMGWAPQVKILAHSSIGGFLTHCGWNSIVEGLGYGRVLILFPVMNDQGLNARLLSEKRLGVEIPRDELTGSFTRDSVAESVRFALVEEDGESLRAAAKEMRGVFGDEKRNDSYIDGFARYLVENRRKERT